jgi:hypothetical protein
MMTLFLKEPRKKQQSYNKDEPAPSNNATYLVSSEDEDDAYDGDCDSLLSQVMTRTPPAIRRLTDSGTSSSPLPLHETSVKNATKSIHYRAWFLLEGMVLAVLAMCGSFLLFVYYVLPYEALLAMGVFGVSIVLLVISIRDYWCSVMMPAIRQQGLLPYLGIIAPDATTAPDHEASLFRLLTSATLHDLLMQTTPAATAPSTLCKQQQQQPKFDFRVLAIYFMPGFTEEHINYYIQALPLAQRKYLQEFHLGRWLLGSSMISFLVNGTKEQTVVSAVPPPAPRLDQDDDDDASDLGIEVTGNDLAGNLSQEQATSLAQRVGLILRGQPMLLPPPKEPVTTVVASTTTTATPTDDHTEDDIILYEAMYQSFDIMFIQPLYQAFVVYVTESYLRPLFHTVGPILGLAVATVSTTAGLVSHYFPEHVGRMKRWPTLTAGKDVVLMKRTHQSKFLYFSENRVWTTALLGLGSAATMYLVANYVLPQPPPPPHAAASGSPPPPSSAASVYTEAARRQSMHCHSPQHHHHEHNTTIHDDEPEEIIEVEYHS